MVGLIKYRPDLVTELGGNTGYTYVIMRECHRVHLFKPQQINGDVISTHKINVSLIGLSTTTINLG